MTFHCADCGDGSNFELLTFDDHGNEIARAKFRGVDLAFLEACISSFAKLNQRGYGTKLVVEVGTL